MSNELDFNHKQYLSNPNTSLISEDINTNDNNHNENDNDDGDGDGDDNIQIYIRLKPSSPKNSLEHLSITNHSKTINLVHKNKKLSFTFNKIFNQSATQSEIFNKTINPIFDSFMNGYNSTIICYGQTGSGKTFTMMGDSANQGIIPKVFNKIFNEIENAPITSQYTIALSYLEIYNDSINDLLINSHITNKDNKNSIIIRESSNNNIYIDGLTKVYVSNLSDVTNLLEVGNSNRKVSETKMNISSSRSHSILKVEISTCNNITNTVYNSTLFLVDLAGSERIDKSGISFNDNSNKFKEAIGINSSLSVLGNVINLLSIKNLKTQNQNKNLHIPYRDSKLTRILQDSLGGNSKTAIIINCSSEYDDLNETLSSLRFAQRARDVCNNVSINKSNIEIDNDNINNCTESANEDQNLWKLKYVNALKKIVTLETKLESNVEVAFNSGNTSKDINDLIKSLKTENSKLRDENKIYKQSIKDFKNEKLHEALDRRLSTSTTIHSLQSLKSDVEIFKKLLVSKTDQILELEEKFENLKKINNSSFLNTNSNNNKESLNIMKEMSNNINIRNSELAKQVEQAKSLLIQKENQLRIMHDKLKDRDEIVSIEHNEVDKKLNQLSNRLKNSNNNSPDRIYYKKYHTQQGKSSDFSPDDKLGLNLHIVKPPE